jgi:hypothetical protein
LFQTGYSQPKFWGRRRQLYCCSAYKRVWALICLSFASIVHDACGIRLETFDAVGLDEDDNNDNDKASV